ncbi:MAG: hypothetical protein R2865_10655 [Deinococcales bacterium]
MVDQAASTITEGIFKGTASRFYFGLPFAGCINFNHRVLTFQARSAEGWFSFMMDSAWGDCYDGSLGLRCGRLGARAPPQTISTSTKVSAIPNRSRIHGNGPTQNRRIPKSPSKPDKPSSAARLTRPGKGVAAPSQNSNRPSTSARLLKLRPSLITRLLKPIITNQ